jgi:hypothetical protein
MCFAWISEQTAIISLYRNKWLFHYNRSRECLLRGTDWVFKSDRYNSVIIGLIYSLKEASVWAHAIRSDVGSLLIRHVRRLEVYLFSCERAGAETSCRLHNEIDCTSLDYFGVTDVFSSFCSCHFSGQFESATCVNAVSQKAVILITFFPLRLCVPTRSTASSLLRFY